jgi:proline iminopeptidase
LDYYHQRVAGDSRSHPLHLVNRMTGFSRVRPEFVLLDRVKELTQPVLIIVGQHDKLVPPNLQHLKGFNLIPKVQIEIFNDSGHVPFIEESQRFNALVINFLNG